MKITTTASEMVSSLMINYIALYFGNYMLNNVIGDPKASAASYKLSEASELPVLIQGTRVHLGFIIAIAVAVLGYLFLYRTKMGYELRLAGENEEFARYSGVSIVKVIVLSQILGGFVAGEWKCSARFTADLHGLHFWDMDGMRSLSVPLQRKIRCIHLLQRCFLLICVPVLPLWPGEQM